MYMTATPRLYKAEDQQRAREREAYLCSMDDAEIYGDEFYRLGFGEAVDKNLLSDYKVLILNVEPGDVSTEVQVALSGLDAAVQKEVDTDDMAKLIGVINALSKRSRYDNRLLREIDPQPMHRAVAFCQNIKVSKAITAAFNACAESYYESLSPDEREGLVRVEAHHVDGSMGAARREEYLGWLKRTRTDGLDCHLLSNVRCLSEGIDVPSLDAVVFLAAKSEKQTNVGCGLFTYPVLMAADIILYDSNVVPVGADQKQHVELARDIAERMNNKYGNLFVVPEPIIPKVGAKIKDLQDPTKKMSKSAEDTSGIIFLLDSEAAIKKKVNRAVTDNDGYVAFDEEKKPGISNLITLYSALSGTPLQEAIDHFTGWERYGDFKKEVLEVIYETLRPVQAEYERLSQTDYVDEVLNRGRDRANEIANREYDLVRRAVGFGR